MPSRHDRLPIGTEGHMGDRRVMRQGRAYRYTRLRVPQPRRLVRTPGQDGFAVGTEGDGVDFHLVAQRRSNGFPCIQVPHERRVVAPVSGEEFVAVQTESRSNDSELVRRSWLDRLL